jgi:hypothetical protein
MKPQLSTQQLFEQRLRNPKVHSFLAALAIGLRRVSGDAVAMCKTDPENSKTQHYRLYPESLAWLIGAVRHSMIQRLLVELAVMFGFRVRREQSRVTVYAGGLVIHACRVSSPKKLPKESLAKKSLAADPGQGEIFSINQMPEPNVYVIIGVGYWAKSKSRPTLEQRYVAPRFIQIGSPDETFSNYAFAPIDIEEYLSHEEAVTPDSSVSSPEVTKLIDEQLRLRRDQQKRKQSGTNDPS